MTAERSGGVPRQSNPFDGELAHANSSRAVLRGRKLVRAPRGKPTAPLQEFAHDSFRALVLNPTSPAWGQSRRSGAEAATSTSTRRWARRGRPRSSRDLFDFVGEQENLSGEFSCFVACFEAPAGFDEEAFEGLLWEQLQRLHEQDRRHHSWDPAVSPDPEDPTFAFSFAGTAFFVGLHAASSRSARRFAWPTLVFNAHHQFDRLRKESRYDRFQEIIRDRERDLQGILTPNLADFGTRSEARQYFGRPVQGGWRCPFQGLQANDPHKGRQPPATRGRADGGYGPLPPVTADGRRLRAREGADPASYGPSRGAGLRRRGFRLSRAGRTPPNGSHRAGPSATTTRSTRRLATSSTRTTATRCSRSWKTRGQARLPAYALQPGGLRDALRRPRGLPPELAGEPD